MSTDWGTQGRLRKANYPPDTSEKTQPDTSSLMRCRTRKTPKIKNKLQEINLLGSVFSHNDIEINLSTPLGCYTSCLGLYLLFKITKTQKKKKLPKLKINSLQEKQAEARERALESSPNLHLQHVDFRLLIKNNKIHTSDILKMVLRILVWNQTFLCIHNR